MHIDEPRETNATGMPVWFWHVEDCTTGFPIRNIMGNPLEDPIRMYQISLSSIFECIMGPEHTLFPCSPTHERTPDKSLFMAASFKVIAFDDVLMICLPGWRGWQPLRLVPCILGDEGFQVWGQVLPPLRSILMNTIRWTQIRSKSHAQQQISSHHLRIHHMSQNYNFLPKKSSFFNIWLNFFVTCWSPIMKTSRLWSS